MTSTPHFVLVFLIAILAAERVAVECRKVALHHDAKRTVSMIMKTSEFGAKL